MSAKYTFDEILSIIEDLSPEEQADLVTIINHRLAALGRQRLVADVREARAEFQTGLAMPESADQIMNRILAAEDAITEGKGVNWREVRSDV